jgi:lipopolysaccharide/colanic/teichoic acid biosynthesis glycosyltransferase
MTPPRGLPRAFDVVVATLALALAAPLLALAMLAIRLDSKGPAIYRQRRVGLGGREFELIKLRTMRPGSDPVGVGTAVTGDDPRVTRVGSILRRTSLDELPNLVNVLRGDMAIVGPRPTLPAQVALYNERQRRRLDVRPGMTGWAQVNGRTAVGWTERMELDAWYVDNRTALLDLQIIARSIAAVLTGRGFGSEESIAVPEGWEDEARRAAEAERPD